MQELRWLWMIGSIEQGVQLVNQLEWNISVEEISYVWYVKSGDQVLLRSDSKETVDAFLYGLALAYAVLPEDLFEHVKREIRSLTE